MSGQAAVPVQTGSSRRQLLKAALGASVAMGTTLASAQSADAPAGPRVWLGYDQKQLDDAYNQAVWAPNMATLIARGVINSEIARRYLPPKKVWQYGTGPDRNIEGYLASGKGKLPIHVFIHGGAWRAGAAADYAYLAEPFLAKGVHFLSLNFPNAPQVNGDLAIMGKDVQDAIAWIARHAAEFGGDADEIFISGHSSGAHLAAVALTTRWEQQYGLRANLIKGAVLISGLYELKPVRLSSRSSYLRITDDIEQALSPQRYVAQVNAHVDIVHGSLESPEFKRQSREFAAALRQASKSVDLLITENYNHFETVEGLGSPFGAAGRLALRQIAKRA